MSSIGSGIISKIEACEANYIAFQQKFVMFSMYIIRRASVFGVDKL